MQGYQCARLCRLFTEGSSRWCKSWWYFNFATLGLQWLSSYYKLRVRGTFLAFSEDRHRNNFDRQLESSRCLCPRWFHRSLCRACGVLHSSYKCSCCWGPQHPSSKMAASLTGKFRIGAEMKALCDHHGSFQIVREPTRNEYLLVWHVRILLERRRLCYLKSRITTE